MTSINFKVIGLTRPEIEPAGSRLKPATFRLSNLPAWETDALLIQPLRLVIAFLKMFFYNFVDYIRHRVTQLVVHSSPPEQHVHEVYEQTWVRPAPKG